MPEEATSVLPSPESEMLVCCARRSMRPAELARLRELAEARPDWPAVMHASWLHGLLPLVHTHLGGVADAVPPDVRDQFRRRFAENARWNLMLSGEMKRLLLLLEGRGIPVAPFKGPVLAQQLYGNIALREIGDLDLVVLPEHAALTQDALLSAGYRPALQLSPAQERALLRSQKGREFVREEPQTVVELHWALSGPRDRLSLDLHALFARAETFEFAGMPVRVFAPDDQLLLLCLHGSRHMWERLEWLCGIAEVLRSGTADPARVLAAADALRAGRMVLLGLALGRALLGAPLPPAVDRRIAADPMVRSLAARAADHISRRGNAWSFSLGLPFHRFQLDLRERWVDRASYVWHALVEPAKEDWRAVRLPDPLFPLYRVIRPIRLSVAYLRRHGRSEG